MLLLLSLSYVFNFADRQILTVLAPFIKANLKITDVEIGLLYGTSFALFYAVLGLPLSRLADSWNRVKTLSLGLAVWSFMTSLSGLATGFASLPWPALASVSARRARRPAPIRSSRTISRRAAAGRRWRCIRAARSSGRG